MKSATSSIDGSFICMLTNGLSMMAAHYLFKQPERAGWVGPDCQFQQIRQANTRKRVARKEAIKNAWAGRKASLAMLMPSSIMMVYRMLYNYY